MLRVFILFILFCIVMMFVFCTNVLTPQNSDKSFKEGFAKIRLYGIKDYGILKLP